MILLSKAMDVGRDHLIHRKRSPFPYEGKDLTLEKVGKSPRVGRDTSVLRRAKRCRVARRGGALRRAGGLEGFTPPHRFKARTAASDGQRAFTRAARSAGLNFAVILQSKAMDVGRDHLIHRKRSPFPYEGKDLTPGKVGLTSNVG